MTATTSLAAPLIRAAGILRTLGWAMLAIVIVGMIGASTRGVLAVVAVVWAAPSSWWAWRVAHVAVSAEPDALIVHNPLRTHRLPYDSVLAVRVEPARLPVPGGFLDRSSGVVDVRTRARPVRLAVTQPLWSSAPVFRRRGEPTGNRQVDVIRSWCVERSAPPV